MSEKVKCPNCGHVFDSSKTFAWDSDEDGYPTVEYLQCPHCRIATSPMMECEHCPGHSDGKHKCTLEDLCSAASFVAFNDFQVVEEEQ
jgi:uncharacterized C2H2 Zn-finger protein